MKHICKNCKYFKEGKTCNTCDCNKFVYTGAFEKINKKSDYFGYSDYEGYDANFEIGENFGCIHWEVNLKKIKKFKHILIEDLADFIMYSKKEFNELHPNEYTDKQYEEAKNLMDEDLAELAVKALKAKYGEDND